MSITVIPDDKEQCRWIIPQTGGMRVPGLIIGSEDMIRDLQGTKALEQVRNVAYLPGIIGYSLAMPDIHEGYGFPIGGVAAVDLNEGVVSPGGIGYDINCGVRLITSGLEKEDLNGKLDKCVDCIFQEIPAGVGKQGKISLSRPEMDQVLVQGAKWAVDQGFGNAWDTDFSEEGGAMQGADPSGISEKAYRRGKTELGTLGAGNHFIEIGYVREIFNSAYAETFGMFKNQVVFWIHTGSRGLGHQVCSEYLGLMGKAVKKYGLILPDRQLNSAPINSPEGEKYLGAMAAAANYAWANRQVLTHYVRNSVCRSLRANSRELNMRLLYDVTHNVGKIETHVVSGEPKKVLVHRKGATRAFAPGNTAIPSKYENVGQPVLVPGDMGRASYVLAGTQKAMEISFGSACHGAGRALSRSRARKTILPGALKKDLSERGVYVKAASIKGLVEEAPEAYKNVDDVVEAAVRAGLVQKVAMLKPLGVVKG